MEDNRIEKIRKIWKDIHGDWISMFHWSHYKSLEYYYNEKTNSIECECGVAIPINASTEDITEELIHNLIWELDKKIQDYYWENFKIIINDD